MLSMLRFECARMLLSCLLAAIAAGEQFSLYLQGYDHISVFYRWIGEENMTFGSQYLRLIVPLFAAMAYGYTGCTDRTEGYIHHLLTRASRRSCYAAKYIVTFLSGGLVFLSGVLLNFMLLALFMPLSIPIPENGTSMISPFHFCSQWYYTNPLLFLFAWLGVAMLWGGFMAIVGLLAGMISRNRTVAMVTPFFLFLSEGVLASYCMTKLEIMIDGRVLELVWTDMLSAGTPAAAPTAFFLLMLGVLIAVNTVIYVGVVKTHECL